MMPSYAMAGTPRSSSSPPFVICSLYGFWTFLYLGVILRETYYGTGKAVGTYSLWFIQEFFLNSPLSVFWFLRASALGLAVFGLLFLIPKMKPIYLLPLALILFFIGTFGDSYYVFLNDSLKSVYDRYLTTFYTTRTSRSSALSLWSWAS
jgi:hypothetical protein